MLLLRVRRAAGLLPILGLAAGCGADLPQEPASPAAESRGPRPEIYADAVLTADLSYYTDRQRKMLVRLIEASKIMDDLFWRQAFGDGHEAWLASIEDPRARLFAAQNYGPWDRLGGGTPFIDGYGPKPAGANFYPSDMTKEEFEGAYLPGKNGRYSLVRRDADGQLKIVPYQVAYAGQLGRAAELLRGAADLAESADFAVYLKLRANALVSDDYQLSDLFWMDVRGNEIDIVFGPTETCEDEMLGYRAAYGSLVLLKDLEWSVDLMQYADMLPDLQAGLPVPSAYKREPPGYDTEIGAYDVVYYAGHANAGANAVAVNLPGDEEVQLQKGTRRLQLKNAMRAKFDKILVPVASLLIDEDQLGDIAFDAYFALAMFHELAHGLGIRNTLTGRGTVREALLDLAASTEESKADVLALYMIERLREAGELGDADIMDYYVTSMASTLSSIRSGATSANGRANMVRFNYFLDRGAYFRDEASGRYRVDGVRMRAAIEDFSRRLVVLQGDGDYAAVAAMTSTQGVIRPQLKADLDRLRRSEIPVDVRFRQGLDVLGLDTD